MYDQVIEIINKVKFKDWEFYIGGDDSRRYMQVRFMAPDADTGKPEMQFCRKWFLSPYMTETEVVNTCLNAVQSAMQHEIREFFTYEDVRVYDPHTSIRALMAASQQQEKRK